MNKLREKGITLVALVVTIIILLILAGVTLSLALSDTGLFKKAQNASDRYKSAQEKETTQLGELEKTFNEYDNGTVPSFPKTHSKDDLKDKLSNGEGNDSVIGKKVTGLTGGVSEDYDWEIFYVDNSNIYLISTNYIRIADCPTKNNKTFVSELAEYSGRWTADLYDEYEGSSDITDERIKELNSDLFKIQNFTSTDSNMKSVAYLLDAEIWTNKIVGNNEKVDYVIGGPSIELVFKAYNAKHGTNFEAKAFDESAQSGYSKGYKIRTESDSEWQYRIQNMLDINDSTFLVSYQGCADYWFSSPSCLAGIRVMHCNTSGYVGGDNGQLGLRPVVCLKSDVQLEEIEGGYRIK